MVAEAASGELALVGGLPGKERLTVRLHALCAVEAGVLLGLAYHLSRSLPLVIGIHMAWNFMQQLDTYPTSSKSAAPTNAWMPMVAHWRIELASHSK